MDDDDKRRAQAIADFNAERTDGLIGPIPFELSGLVTQMFDENWPLERILEVIKEKKAELRKAYKERGEEPWGW
jgi:hypothetical protein